MSTEYCSVCEELSGHIPVPGGVVYRDAWWEVAPPHRGLDRSGELIVKARRHVASMSALTSAEAASLAQSSRSGRRDRARGAARARLRRVLQRARAARALLPSPSHLEPLAGHVLSDVYRRARSQLRKWRIVPNPTTAARAETAERIRSDDAWKPLST